MPRTKTKFNTKPDARRHATNNAFLTACLAVASLSVLALAVLLIAIFLQGTRSLFGFQITVLPQTDNATSITIEPDRQRIAFQYPSETPGAPPDTTFLYAPVDLDLSNASVVTENGTAFLEQPAGQRIRIGDTGSALARIAVVGDFDPSQPANFIGGEPSRRPSDAGFRAPLIGSLWLLAVCALAAIPLGVGTAIFLEEYSPKSRPLRILHSLVQTNIRHLAGVPSVVYGLIGLTAFARAFGLFGAPGQFTNFQIIHTENNTSIIGQIAEDRRERTFRITTDYFGTIQFNSDDAEPDAKLSIDQPLTLTGTIDLDQNTFDFVINTDEAGTLRLDAAEASNLNQAALFSGDFEPVTIKDATLTLIDEGGTTVIQTPDQGRISVNTAEIKDRDSFLVRHHTYTLEPGSTITRTNPSRTGDPTTETRTLENATRFRGEALELNANRITLVISRSSGHSISFDASAIRDYDPARRFQIGDEDTPLFIALPFGTSVLAGGLTLMLVILPVIIIASQESLRAVPNSHREGALALGSTRLQMIFRMTLPAAIPGILTGSILAMSRAIGEAAPILIIGGAGFVTFAPDNLMSGFAAMPLQIYSWTSNADREFQLVAASGIIVLLTVLFAFNATAVFIRARLQNAASN